MSEVEVSCQRDKARSVLAVKSHIQGNAYMNEKWEYGILTAFNFPVYIFEQYSPDSENLTWGDLSEAMRELGLDGWELVTVLRGESKYDYVYHFKRKISQASKTRAEE